MLDLYFFLHIRYSCSAFLLNLSTQSNFSIQALFSHWYSCFFLSLSTSPNIHSHWDGCIGGNSTCRLGDPGIMKYQSFTEKTTNKQAGHIVPHRSQQYFSVQWLHLANTKQEPAKAAWFANLSIKEPIYT